MLDDGVGHEPDPKLYCIGDTREPEKPESGDAWVADPKTAMLLASSSQWRQLVLVHGTPAGKVGGGDRRTAKIEAHAAFVLAAMKQQPDPTLVELREMWVKGGVTPQHGPPP